VVLRLSTIISTLQARNRFYGCLCFTRRSSRWNTSYGRRCLNVASYEEESLSKTIATPTKLWKVETLILCIDRIQNLRFILTAIKTMIEIGGNFCNMSEIFNKWWNP